MCYVEVNDVPINMISVPSMITLRKAYLLEPNMIEFPIMLKVPGYDFLDQFDRKSVLDKVDEINMIFISDLKIFHLLIIWFNRNQCFVED